MQEYTFVLLSASLLIFTFGSVSTHHYTCTHNVLCQVCNTQLSYNQQMLLHARCQKPISHTSYMVHLIAKRDEAYWTSNLVSALVLKLTAKRVCITALKYHRSGNLRTFNFHRLTKWQKLNARVRNFRTPNFCCLSN